jgi:hypothetical protein
MFDQGMDADGIRAELGCRPVQWTWNGIHRWNLRQNRQGLGRRGRSLCLCWREWGLGRNGRRDRQCCKSVSILSTVLDLGIGILVLETDIRKSRWIWRTGKVIALMVFIDDVTSITAVGFLVCLDEQC